MDEQKSGSAAPSDDQNTNNNTSAPQDGATNFVITDNSSNGSLSDTPSASPSDANVGLGPDQPASTAPVASADNTSAEAQPLPVSDAASDTANTASQQPSSVEAPVAASGPITDTPLAEAAPVDANTPGLTTEPAPSVSPESPLPAGDAQQPSPEPPHADKKTVMTLVGVALVLVIAIVVLFLM